MSRFKHDSERDAGELTSSGDRVETVARRLLEGDSMLDNIWLEVLEISLLDWLIYHELVVVESFSDLVFSSVNIWFAGSMIRGIRPQPEREGIGETGNGGRAVDCGAESAKFSRASSTTSMNTIISIAAFNINRDSLSTSRIHIIILSVFESTPTLSL